MNYKKEKEYEYIGWVLFWIGFSISIIAFFAFTLNRHFFLKGHPINAELHGQFGDFIGGIVGTLVALIGVLLLYATLTAQRNAFRKQQVESRFFELLKMHRENVNEMTLAYKKGRNVLIHIYQELNENIESIRAIYKVNTTLKPKEEWKHASLTIAYYMTYFGVTDSNRKFLRRKVEEVLQGENSNTIKIIDRLIKVSMIKNLDYKTEDVIGSEDKEEIPNFIGHQSRLGHYFRHLYQIVNFINKLPSDFFTYSEKYEYVRTLRAQLSVYEQALLFYNSITDLGNAWEKHPEINDENSKLITKYNLIKNIPDGFIQNANITEYYPSIYYEFDIERPSKRDILENIYTRMAI